MVRPILSTHQFPIPNSKDEKFLTLSFTALRIKKQQHSNFFLINHVLLASIIYINLRENHH
jgi:hypothetical protein